MGFLTSIAILCCAASPSPPLLVAFSVADEAAVLRVDDGLVLVARDGAGDRKFTLDDISGDTLTLFHDTPEGRVRLRYRTDDTLPRGPEATVSTVPSSTLQRPETP